MTSTEECTVGDSAIIVYLSQHSRTSLIEGQTVDQACIAALVLPGQLLAWRTGTEPAFVELAKAAGELQ